MPAAVQHVLTVVLEDDDRVDTLTRTADKTQWADFESRLTRQLSHTFELLARSGAKATFFVLGWTADHFPDVLRAIVEKGHEVASRGYYPRAIADRRPDEIRSDLAAARAAIERATGLRVYGYRVAVDWIGPDEHWVLEVLADEGYSYDSSLLPTGFRYASDGGRRFAHAYQTGGRSIWEFPLSSDRFLGYDRPMMGARPGRVEPTRRTLLAMDDWVVTRESPLVISFRAWDVDPDELGEAPKTPPKPGAPAESLQEFLTRHRFVGIGDYLKLPPTPAPPAVVVDLTPADAPATSPAPALRAAATVIVPLHNHEARAQALAETFDRMRVSAGTACDFRFLLVDDASTDATWDCLSRVFTGRPDVKFVRHEYRRGITAAILSGVMNAGTEIVCTIEPDGGCDPVELVKMISMLTDGVAMVTAAPLQPDGRTERGPFSFLYRRVIPAKLRSYTCDTRVFRKGVATQFILTYSDERGIPELLGRLSLAGGTVAEHPVASRGAERPRPGQSRLGHLALIGRLAIIRLTKWARPPQPLEDRNVTIRNVIAAASKPDVRIPRGEVAPKRPDETISSAAGPSTGSQ